MMLLQRAPAIPASHFFVIQRRKACDEEKVPCRASSSQQAAASTGSLKSLHGSLQGRFLRRSKSLESSMQGTRPHLPFFWVKYLKKTRISSSSNPALTPGQSNPQRDDTSESSVSPWEDREQQERGVVREGDGGGEGEGESRVREEKVKKNSDSSVDVNSSVPLKALYGLRIVTGRGSRSGLSMPTAGVRIAIIGNSMETTVVQRIGRVIEEMKGGGMAQHVDSSKKRLREGGNGERAGEREEVGVKGRTGIGNELESGDRSVGGWERGRGVGNGMVGLEGRRRKEKGGVGEKRDKDGSVMFLGSKEGSFEQGSVDEVWMVGPNVGTVRALWIAPEAGTWRFEEASLLVVPIPEADAKNKIADVSIHLTGQSDDISEETSHLPFEVAEADKPNLGPTTSLVASGTSYLFRKEAPEMIGDFADFSALELRPAEVEEKIPVPYGGEGVAKEVSSPEQLGAIWGASWDPKTAKSPASLEAETLKRRTESMEEYKRLKEWLLRTSVTLALAGTVGAAVLGFTEEAKAFALGGFAGLLYILRLQNRVDSIPSAGIVATSAAGTGGVGRGREGEEASVEREAVFAAREEALQEWEILGQINGADVRQLSPAQASALSEFSAFVLEQLGEVRELRESLEELKELIGDAEPAARKELASLGVLCAEVETEFSKSFVQMKEAIVQMQSTKEGWEMVKKEIRLAEAASDSVPSLMMLHEVALPQLLLAVAQSESIHAELMQQLGHVRELVGRLASRWTDFKLRYVGTLVALADQRSDKFRVWEIVGGSVGRLAVTFLGVFLLFRVSSLGAENAVNPRLLLAGFLGFLTPKIAVLLAAFPSLGTQSVGGDR